MELAAYLPVWGRLTRAQQEALAGNAVRRSVKKGEIIRNGADCTGLLLVLEGQLRAYILSPEGREMTIYRLFERDVCLFSASCMLRSIQFDVIVEAEKDSELAVIPADVYKRILEESAPLSNYTNEMMASRFSDVMWLIEQILWKSFDKRLAAFLLEEAAIEGTNTLQTTHETLGKHLGNPREVVTRMLRYFQSEGLVRLSRGRVEIVDEAGLRRLAE
ncbi:MAG TPA: Crp/Fnr family transcriptional regulator [Candidatus Aphodomonas merdavium]|nr:Crp/Fnr family transcriptional regulator [Candidatus Aphodomonas merdavium]